MATRIECRYSGEDARGTREGPNDRTVKKTDGRYRLKNPAGSQVWLVYANTILDPLYFIGY